jgi:WD40 repeat protein
VLTVVLGKSGIGKTSLLQAGLIPKLRKNYYLPIYVRIRFDDDKESPVEQLKAIIESEIKELDQTAISFNGLTSWEYFYKVRIFEGHVKPLLFFDQFEELFTGGKQKPEQVDPLVTEIGDLVQNWLPVTVQEKFKNKSIPYPDKKPNYRVIFSLREEYLPQLKNLSRYMPSIVNGRSHYRVSHMKGEDAIDAVIKPGKEIIKDPEVAVEIIRKIPESEDTDYNPYEEQNGSWKGKKIEPFLLSLFCYEINKKRLDAGAGEISRELVEDVKAEDILKDFYEKNISQFEPNVKTAIEELLLTAEGHRKLQDMNTLKTGHGVTYRDIRELVDRRIIRQETRMGIDYIELIHDRLAPILKESRDKRKAEEKRKEELKKEEEKRKRELEEKKKKYSRIIITVISMAAIFLAGLTWYAFVQKTKAEKAQEIAEKEKTKAEKESRNNKAYELAARSVNLLEKDPTLSFRLAESAYQTEKNNPDAYKSLLNSFYNYNGKFYSAIFDHENKVNYAAFSPDGEYIITIDRDRSVRHWDFHGKLIKRANVYQGTINAGNILLTGEFKAELEEDDKTVRLQLPGGKWTRLKGHTAPVKSAVLAPDRKYIITASDDTTARLWDLEFVEDKIKIFSRHTSERFDFFACFSRDGKQILTANMQKVLLWDLSDNKTPKEVETGSLYKPFAAFSPDGKYIVITTPSDGKIRLFRSDGKLERELKGHKEGVYSAAFSPDSKTIITANRDNKARLWNLEGEQIRVFEGHHDAVNFAAFSPKGRYVVTASWDKTARLWDLETNKSKGFKGHKDNVCTAVFSPNGKNIVTASKDGTARLWNLEGRQIRDFEGHTGAVRSALFSPGGQYIITASDDKTARLWKLNGIQVFEYKGFNHIIRRASFSPDGKYILIAPARGPAQLRLVDPEEIIRSVNERNVWQLDTAAKKKYNL